MAYYLKWSDSSGDVANNTEMLEISGITGVLASISYKVKNNAPAYTENRTIFDIRRTPGSTADGGDIGYIVQFSVNGVDSGGTSNHRINGQAASAKALIEDHVIDDELSFDVGSAPSEGTIALGARFNEVAHNYGFSVSEITIIDDAGTHVIDMSDSGGIAGELLSKDSALTATLLNFPTDGSQWVHYYDWVNDPLDTSVQHGLFMQVQGQSFRMPMNGAYDVTAYFADGTTENLTGNGTHVYDGRYDPFFVKVEGFDADGQIFYDCNQAGDLGYIPELVQGKHGFVTNFNTFTGISTPYTEKTDGVYFPGSGYGLGGGQFKYTPALGDLIEYDFIPDDNTGNGFLGRNSNYGYFFLDNGKVIHRYNNGHDSTIATDLYVVGERVKLAIQHGNNEFSVYKNGVFVETVSETNYYSTGTTFNGVGNRGTSFKGTVFSIKVFSGGYGGYLVNHYDFNNARGFGAPDLIGGERFQLGSMLEGIEGPVLRTTLSDAPVGYAFRGGSSADNFALIGNSISVFSSMVMSVKFDVFLASGWDNVVLGPSNNKAIQITPTHWYVKGEYAGDKITKPHGFTFTNNDFYEIEVRRDNTGLTELVVNGTVVDSQVYSSITTDGFNSIGKARIGNYLYSNPCVIYQRVVITNDTAHHDYDMLTGDYGKIIDMASANHATINNEIIEGSRPIVNQRIFSTNQDGVGADYALTTSNIQTMVSSANSADERMVIYIVGDVVSDGHIRIGYLGEANHQPVIDGLIPFNGDLKDTVNNRTVLFTSGNWFNYQDIYFRNMLTDAVDIGVGSKGLVENVGFDGTGVEVDGQNGESGIVRNCTMSGIGTRAQSDEASRRSLIVVDSILTGRMTIRQFNTVTLINCLSTATDLSLSYSDSEINVYNSLVKQASMDSYTVNHTGNTFGADFTGAFVDDVNSNYQINQTWADTNLVGKGDQNTDIAEWAYTPVSTKDVQANLLIDALGYISTQEDYNKLISSIVEADAELTILHQTSQVIEKLVSVILDADSNISTSIYKDVPLNAQILANSLLSNTISKEISIVAELEAHSSLEVALAVSKVIASNIHANGSLSSLVSGNRSSTVSTEAKAAVSAALSSGKLTSTFLEANSLVDASITIQKSVDIVIDSLGEVSLNILSEGIRDVAVAIALNSSADITPKVLAGKVLNTILEEALAGTTVTVEKAAELSCNILANGNMYTSILANKNTTLQEVKASLGISSEVAKSAGIISTIDASSDDNISVHINKDIADLSIESSSSAFISVNIGKGTAQLIEGNSKIEISDVRVNKYTGTLVVESSSGVDVLILSDFDDTNVTVVEIPVRVQNRVLEFVVKK